MYFIYNLSIIFYINNFKIIVDLLIIYNKILKIIMYDK
jgi:hypothetical protein